MSIFTTLEIERDRAYADYEAGYNAARQEAMDDMVCFCRCGCRNHVTSLGAFGYGPNRCDECKKAGSKGVHTLMPIPVESFDWAKYEEPVELEATPHPKPVISTDLREEAESYVRKAGHHGFKSLARMRDRITGSGRPLSDTQARVALRRKAADQKEDASLYASVARSERRAAKTMDILRVFIPETVTPGWYAVETDHHVCVRIRVKRPKGGVLRGFVVIHTLFGDDIDRPGLQYPGPNQFYRGEGAHLIARLVANPEAARTLYREVLGREDAA